ncbi:hypothetical protein [Neorhizobium sp. NCHU2750]|uniref:hypothetical protein n=1 Tax=Neorhizobium sp. NCHU2750 TaxID=1825976 RepID=UPI000E724B6E
MAQILAPDSGFSFAENPDQVKKRLGASWRVSEHAEFIVRRSQGKFVSEQRFLESLLASADQAQTQRFYRFYFSSPVTGSRLYRVVHLMKRDVELGGLLPLAEWPNLVLARWGAPALVGNWFWQGDISTTYYLDRRHNVLRDGATRCRGDALAFYDLAEKSASELDVLLRHLARSGCAYFLQITAKSLSNGVIEQVASSVTDIGLAAEDARQRLMLGYSPRG